MNDSALALRANRGDVGAGSARDEINGSAQALGANRRDEKELKRVYENG